MQYSPELLCIYGSMLYARVHAHTFQATKKMAPYKAHDINYLVYRMKALENSMKYTNKKPTAHPSVTDSRTNTRLFVFMRTHAHLIRIIIQYNCIWFAIIVNLLPTMVLIIKDDY